MYDKLTIISNTFVRDFFDQAASTWDARGKADDSVLNAIVAAANPPQNARILDVACGTGIMFAPLLKRSPALLRAIDLSPKMVSLAKAKYQNHPAVKVSVQNFYTFNETGFDLIMVYNAYPHFMDKAQFAAQICKCLAPGGRFVIAHGIGKQKINTRHSGKKVQPISTSLLSCKEEAKRLGDAFLFDIMLDCEHMYILSGHIKP
ncbi:MAG: class I SAM-dependent methyltransferase [Oscillospiraceae bacterium]